MIEFITPVFDKFTLAFPPFTEAEKQRAKLVSVLDGLHEATASEHTKIKAAERKTRRTRRALSNTVRGGLYFPPPSNRAHAPLAVKPSTRGASRRAKFGRA